MNAINEETWHTGSRLTDSAVVAQAAHTLVGELWIEAIRAGYNKQGEDGKSRQLWALWDDRVPMPNQHTAPFWFLTCEAGVGMREGAKTFSFVPPIATPLQWEAVPDSGYDAFITPKAVPIVNSPRRLIGTKDRKEMYKLHFDAATPIAEYRFGRLQLRTKPIARRDAVRESQLDTVWRERRKLLRHVGAPPKTPTCPKRLFNVAGLHMKDWTTHGLYVIGDYAGASQEWAGGATVRVDHETYLTQMPRASMPFWTGFRMTDGPSKAIFDWCRAYIQYRDSAIRAILDPTSYIGAGDHTNRLTSLGLIQGADGDKDSKKRKPTEPGMSPSWLDSLANLAN